MNRLPVFFRWLIVASLADWLIGRTFTRSAIFMPKSPLVIGIYQTLGTVGQVAATLTDLLTLGALIWIAWHERRTRSARALPLALVGLMAFNFASLFAAPSGWFAVARHLLTLAAVATLAVRIGMGADRASRKIAAVLPALAILSGALYQTGIAAYQALRVPDLPVFARALFDTGELLVVLSPVLLWWTDRPTVRGNRSAYVLAALPAIAFAALCIANPSLSGILSIWSIGLTLYLPWPLYAVSLWLAGVTVIASLRRHDPAGFAIVLLAAGGYAPQLSTHVFLGVIAVWLLASAGEARAVASTPSPVNEVQSSIVPQSLVTEGTGP